MTTDGYIEDLEEEEEEEDCFFDSREEISSLSESCPGSPKDNSIKLASDDSLYRVWISNPDSIRERRARFLRWMALDAPQESVFNPHISRITSDGGAVLRTSGSENSSSTSTWSADGSSSEESFGLMMKNLDNGSSFVVEQSRHNDTPRGLHEVRSNRSLTSDEFNRTFGSSTAQKLMQRGDDSHKLTNVDEVGKGKKIGWLKRLGSFASCVVDRLEEENDSGMSDSDKSVTSRARRVKVCVNKKPSKEFSAVYMEQKINAHNGAILTMKFSPDGELLASGGEDGVVRVWRVMECERRDEGDIPEDDPLCIYFTVNYNSELAPLYAAKEKVRSRSMRRNTDSACVVVPPEVFRISEKPLHEFHGHHRDILDLSWSKDKYLISSSVDKTVRLWKVGCDSCLKVFVHNNYVTCVQFNPKDEKYFVSGSIDGKVRIWEVSQRRVVDWTDIRDLVTAVCYHPEGKGIVVGSMTGDCRFYDVSDNTLQLDVQISLQAKKKAPDRKRITGFQYCPSDHRKLMVTSADSKIRILDGVDIVSKYKGLCNAGSQISASFTSDGRHIISASEDSNVCVWTHDSNGSTLNQIKSTKSFERFISRDVSVAIPWHGPASRNSVSEAPQENYADSLGKYTMYLSPAGSFSLSHELFSEFLPKGSATWPEEKLPTSAAACAATLCKSQYKFLKTSWRNSSHAWGQVIVTAGWDGQIRSFQNYGLPVNN